MTQAIRDIMTKDIECASPESTLQDAASAMKARDIGSLPVCEGKRVVGIITDRDIAIRGVAEGRDPGSTKVRDCMSKDIVSVREDADLKEADRLEHALDQHCARSRSFSGRMVAGDGRVRHQTRRGRRRDR